MFKTKTTISSSLLLVAMLFAGTGVAFSLFSNIEGSLASYDFPAIPGRSAFTAPATAEMVGFTLRQGEGVPFHYHEAPSFVIVTKGTLTEDDGCGNIVTWGAGSAFTEEPGHIHQVYNEGPRVVSVYFSDIYPADSTDAIFVDGPQCDAVK